jgi:hypothetical protein
MALAWKIFKDRKDTTRSWLYVHVRDRHTSDDGWQNEFLKWVQSGVDRGIVEVLVDGDTFEIERPQADWELLQRKNPFAASPGELATRYEEDSIDKFGLYEGMPIPQYIFDDFELLEEHNGVEKAEHRRLLRNYPRLGIKYSNSPVELLLEQRRRDAKRRRRDY